MKKRMLNRLGCGDLTITCSPSQFSGDVPPLSGLIGQEIALRELQKGLHETHPGYHIIVQDTTNRSATRTALRNAVQAIFAQDPEPPELYDYCYVSNFQDQHRPRLIRLPAGDAPGLRDAILRVYQHALPQAHQYFHSKAWEAEQRHYNQRVMNQARLAMQELNLFFVAENSRFRVIPIEEGKGHMIVAAKEHKGPLDLFMVTLREIEHVVPYLAEYVKSATTWSLKFQEEFKKYTQSIRNEGFDLISPESQDRFIELFNERMKSKGLLFEVRMTPVRIVSEPQEEFRQYGTARTQEIPMLWLPAIEELSSWIDESTDEQEREERTKQCDAAHEQFIKVVEEQRQIQMQATEKLQSSADERIRAELAQHFDDIAKCYPSARAYCDDLLEFALKNHRALSHTQQQGADDDEGEDGEEDEGEQQLLNLIGNNIRQNGMKAFVVNVVLTQKPGEEFRPVVLPRDVSFERLFGTIRLEGHMGSYRTDHTKIAVGDLAKANGGALIVSLADILKTPLGGLSFEKLIRTLRTNEYVPEVKGQQFVVGETLEPEPIPLNLKCILVMGPELYYLLQGQPSEFNPLEGLFKVVSPYAPDCARTPENEYAYAQFAETQRRALGLRALAPEAFACIITYGSRLVENKNKLSLQLGAVKHLLIAANAQACIAGKTIIERCHIEQALLEERERKRLLTKKRMDEMVASGHLLIQTSGKEIGKANGLAVLQTGDDMFGNVITVTGMSWRAKDFAFQSVDRSAKMTGKVFDKSTEIIPRILLSRYGKDKFIPLAISVSFEQTYGIDGDSASVIELLVALSALGNIPLRQDVALTGSLNQHGDVQAVGGVNEKVEGFFDACHLQEVTGTQCVLVPQSNVQNLVLADEVVRACEKGTFSVYGYNRWEDAMELMSDLSMEQVDAKIYARIKALNRSAFSRKKATSPKAKVTPQTS